MNHLQRFAAHFGALSSFCLPQTLRLPAINSTSVQETRGNGVRSRCRPLGRTASIDFQAAPNATEFSLVLRQRDVKKRTWAVKLNANNLGVLQDDERSMLRILPIPANALKNGTNTVQFEGEAEGFSDDIEIADVRIEPLPVDTFLRAATVSISAAGDKTVRCLLRLTIVDKEGALVPFASLRSGSYEAQRTGALYTVDGTARIGLPAGEYKIFASRGFEYSAPSERVVLQTGSTKDIRLRLEREVRMPGYVSVDPHVHTFELSRHGDATVDERVLTAAGEGLDIIVATEHNRVDDYAPVGETSQSRSLDAVCARQRGHDRDGPLQYLPCASGNSAARPARAELGCSYENDSRDGRRSGNGAESPAGSALGLPALRQQPSPVECWNESQRPSG